MTESHEPGSRQGRSGRTGRIRWRRFAAILVPSVVVVGVLLGLTANGAIASSFAISGQQFQVAATSLNGTGFQQFGTVDHQVKNSPLPVAESEIGSATIKNLCQSVVTNLSAIGLGDYTLKITAGSGSKPVSASSLIIDANQLSGNFVFKNINIGQDASTLNAVSGVPVGAAGSFGQQSSAITIDNLRQVAWSTSAGTFTLPGFSLHFSAGNDPCF
jgi:hypothetical protein